MLESVSAAARRACRASSPVAFFIAMAVAAGAQPPVPPAPGLPRGPNMPAAGAAPPRSSEGTSGVLRVMIPDNPATGGAASASGTAAGNSGGNRAGAPGPGAPAMNTPAAGGLSPAGNGRPDFRGADFRGTDSREPGGQGASNDPTVPNSEIRRILEGAGRDNAAPSAPVIPSVQVRARVFVAGQPPVAVLEIGGRQVTVREGSEIHVFGADSSVPMQLKVVRMTSSEMRLEVVNRNQFITLD